jgi:DNA-binding NarL/FixJ family response regulator
MIKHKPSFLVADDSSIVLEGIKVLLNANGFHNIDLVRTGTEVIQHLKSKKYNLLYMDIKMLPITGIEVLAELKKLDISQKTIIFSSYTNIDLIIEVFKHNSSGYISKFKLAEDLIVSIDQVLNNQIFVSDDIQDIIAYHNLKFDENKRLEPHNLSKQQLEILEDFVTSYSPNEIALEKKISSSSVRNQLLRIREKFNIKTNIGLVLKYRYLNKE